MNDNISFMNKHTLRVPCAESGQVYTIIFLSLILKHIKIYDLFVLYMVGWYGALNSSHIVLGLFKVLLMCPLLNIVGVSLTSSDGMLLYFYIFLA